jgi:hypothetical protein
MESTARQTAANDEQAASFLLARHFSLVTRHCLCKARADFKAFDKIMRRRRGKPPRQGGEMPRQKMGKIRAPENRVCACPLIPICR